MSMLIVGLMLVAALNTVGASKVSQYKNAEQAIGPMLAEDLMAEILSQNYEEPVDPVEFGRESGESGGSRPNWDDVDDYDSWSASPPQEKDGTDLPGLQGWERSVKVSLINPILLIDSAFDMGGKRIDIQVIHQGRVVTELSSVRTYAWPTP